MPPAVGHFSHVGIDLLRPFPTSDDGNRGIIVCVDHFTKALPTGTAPDIADFLQEQVILRHGTLRELLSGRGAAVLSKIITELLAHHRLTSPSSAD